VQIRPVISVMRNAVTSALSLAASSLVAAAIATAPSDVAAKYASIVVDAKTGKVRHAVNADTRNFPASLTKVMTLYLLFEAVDKKELTMDSRLKVSRRAANQPASKLGLRPGSTIKVRDAANALIVRSANDVATVVAEALAGSERRFALIMTHRARQLGMSRTTFRNASGLPHRGQMSTAKDMATLTRRMINRFPHYYHLFSKTSFSFQGKRYRSHNKLLKTYPGAEGLKTGYIRASGYNLITTAKQNGHRLVGVVFGGNTSRSRNRHMKTLLNRAYVQVRGANPALIAKATPRKSPPKKNQSARRVASKQSASKESVWGIQVGAFYTRKPAASIAQEISRKYARILKQGQITIMPLQKSRNRTLYRARILGLKKRDAYRACRSLKKYKRPCMPVKLPADIEIAAG